MGGLRKLTVVPEYRSYIMSYRAFHFCVKTLVRILNRFLKVFEGNWGSGDGNISKGRKGDANFFRYH